MNDDTRKTWPTDYIAADADAEGKGVGCRKCGCKHAKVTTSRPTPGGTQTRYKTCRHCGYTYTTYESTIDPRA